MDMAITHIIRGDDHLNNTPRQINMLQALHARIPIYAHVPMILGPDGQRLSKRHGAVSVMQYRDEGYLPDALLNYLARLGWSHGDQEVFSRDEMIKLFDINAVNKAAAAFDPEKLLWLNQQYIKNSDPEEVACHLMHFFNLRGLDPKQGPPLVDVVKAQRERAKTLVEMMENSLFFYKDFSSFDDKAATKHLRPEAAPLMQALRQRLAALPAWSAPAIHQAIQDVAEGQGVNLGKLAQPVRVAVAGQPVSPPIDITLALVGRERALKRIDTALNYIQQQPAATA